MAFCGRNVRQSAALLLWGCCRGLGCPGKAAHAPKSEQSSHIFDFSTYLELTLWLAATVLVGRRQVLPEQSVVDVSTAVEVEEGSDAGGLGRVALRLGLGEGLEGAVEAVDVGLVVLGVVQLHDLAGNVRLECAVVVYRERALVSILVPKPLSQNSREPRRNGRTSRLTGQIGKSGLPADELGAGHAHDRLCSLSSQSTAQGGCRSEESGRHFAGGCGRRYGVQLDC